MIERNICYFNLRKIMNSGQVFRMYEPWEGHFVVYSGNRRIELDQDGETVRFYCNKVEFETYWERYFDLQRDYGSIVKKALERNVQGAGFIKASCRFASDIRILDQNIWEMMISFIISQQKQIPSIRKCIEALCKRFGEKHIIPEDRKIIKPEMSKNGVVGEAPAENVWYGFPRAEAIASAGPDGVKGLSLGYRERYIYETAVKYISDGLSERDISELDYAEAKKYLCTFPGIGEKVADCVCLFGCGFLDAFPIDVHIKEILYREFMPDERKKRIENALHKKLNLPLDLPLPKRKIIDSISYSDYLNIIDVGFSDFAGVRGIVQQWIFAYELNG